jgi:hypothetical protein
MLNSGKKNSRFARQKKNIPTLVLSEKKFLNETKNHNPPPNFTGYTVVTGILQLYYIKKK